MVGAFVLNEHEMIVRQTRYFNPFCRSMRFLFSIALSLFFLSALPQQVEANPSGASKEYKVKAAFLYNFLKFIEWPQDQAETPLTICILGENPFDDALLPLQKKQLHGRQLRVKQIKRSEPYDSLCQALFISPSEENYMLEILKKVAQKPILTISDIRNFILEGGGIGFYQEGGRVRFEINANAITEKKLIVSSKLLELAKSS